MTINLHPMQRTVATVAALFFTAVIFLSSFPHVPVA
jgi:preprotein translocase subunit SecG